MPQPMSVSIRLHEQLACNLQHCENLLPSVVGRIAVLVGSKSALSMLAFEATSTQYSHPWIASPSLDNLDSSKKWPPPSTKIKEHSRPRPVSPPFFSSFETEPTRADWIPFADGYAPIGRPWCCAISLLVAQCPSTGNTSSSLVPCASMSPRLLRVRFPPTPSLRPVQPAVGSRHACGLFAAAC